MSFEKTIKAPHERIGVLVGKGGQVKSEIESFCRVSLEIDSSSGDVTIRSGDLDSDPFKAVAMVTAISLGFSPERASSLKDDEVSIEVLDLREYTGKSEDALRRVKGRIIGLEGKARRVIEELTGAYISVYGHTVAVLGTNEEIGSAMGAVRGLASGSPHRIVYERLQKARTKARFEALKLWEGEGR